MRLFRFEGFPFYQFVYIWKWSSAHALGGVSGVASFITTDEQLQYKISFKKEGLPSCSESFNCFVRHLGTFVNASHN